MVEHRRKVSAPRLDKQQRFFERHKNDDEVDLEGEEDLEEEVQVVLLVVEEVDLAEDVATLVGVAVAVQVVLGHRMVLLLVSMDQGNERS